MFLSLFIHFYLFKQHFIDLIALWFEPYINIISEILGNQSVLN